MNSSSAGNPPGGPRRPGLQLPPEQVAELFPFHIVFDAQMRLRQTGPSMTKLIPELLAGSDITTELGLDGPLIPFAFEAILQNTKAIFLVSAKRRGFRLRGQMMPLAGQDAIVFLCSPWLPEHGQFRAAGLTFDDFAVHDSMPEFVQVVQAQRSGMDDLRKLTGKLREQRESIKESNRQLLAQSAESRKLALIAARTHNSVVITDADGFVEWVNGAFTRITGYTLEDLRGKKPGWVLQGPETDRETVAQMARKLRGGEGFHSELVNYRKDGTKFWVAIDAQPIHDESGKITNFMAIESDVTARKDADFRKDLAYSVSTILAESTDAGKALHRILQTIVESLGYRFGAVWRLGAEMETLTPHAIWSPPALRDSHFEAATRSLSFARGVGLPGVVWETNAPTWFPDLSQESNFPRKDAAARDNLRSGFAFPIRVGGKPCGVMEFYSTGCDRPEDELLRTLTGLGNQIGQFIERQEAEGERSRLVSVLHSTLESTTDGILVVDSGRRFVAWNRRFVDMWDIERQMVPAADQAAVLARSAEQVADPAAFIERIHWWDEHPEESGHDLIHLKDGRVLERITQPNRGRKGVIGRVWSYRDVTERWQAEQALRESEERYRMISSTASDGIISVNRSSRILFANQAAERIFGYEPGELVNRDVTELMAPQYRTMDARALLRVAGGAPKHAWTRAAEVAGTRKDGSELPLEMTFGKAYIQGERVVTAVVRDITARRQAEDARQQAMTEIEAANRAKSDFLAGISHEIRTPLNSIAGLAELLRETELNQDQQDMLSTIWACSESLLRLINDLLDVSKIEAGQVDIVVEKFDPVRLCERAIEIVKTRAQHKGLALVSTVEPPSPPPLLGDENRIAQILINLLTNGVKFTERGSVSLHLRWHAMGVGRAIAQFIVEDTGIGIRPQERDKVFEKFYRIDTKVGRQAGGTGLGLNISRLLAELMGGTLELLPGDAPGSRFLLEMGLPLVPVLAPEKTPEPPVTAVLLADPERVDLLRATWQSVGVEALAFDNLPAALAHIEAGGKCDVVLQETCPQWDAGELQQFYRGLSEARKVRCIRIRTPDGMAAPEWSPQGLVENIEYPLTPGKMAGALERVLRETEGAAESGEEAAPPPEQPIARARILLVEDNPDSAAYAKRVFDKAGLDVTVASNVAEALECSEHGHFDVIFMDLMLPDGTGFDATKSIRKRERTMGLPHIPVVALTAHALQRYREQALSASMDDYLTKPVRQEALLSAVRKWLPPSRSGSGAGRLPPTILVDADFADLVPDYLKRIQADLDRVCEMAAEGRHAEMRKAGHDMKGSGGAYGFAEISRVGAMIESAAREGRAAEAEQAAQALKQYLRDVRWEIES